MSRKPKILVVDDSPGNLLALEAVLERDFDLVCADSGASALAILEQRSDIAVVLLDVQMPQMDGYEVAARIKKMPACRDLPIVFITAVYNEDPYIKRGYQAGGVDYFTKPFDPELLRLKVSIYASFRHKSAVLREREEQIRETEELLKAGRKLSAILESLPVGVLIADIEGRICQTNDELSRICKATDAIARDAYGKVLGWWSTSGERIRDANGPLALVLRSGQASHDEKIRITCFDGSSKTILASASPLLGLDGGIVGAVVVIKDMTEPERIEQEFETRVARLVSLGVEIEQSLHSTRPRSTP